MKNSALTKIRNFLFCRKYPFWKSVNAFTGEFLGYESTWYDDILPGWRKAFGKDLSREIKKAGEKYLRAHSDKSWRDILQWRQIKEKYGELRLYATAIDEIQLVLDKYELLSIGYCAHCGKPARYKTRGWIEYYCEDCARRISNSPTGELRLTTGDIPELTTCDAKITKVEECESEASADALVRLRRESKNGHFYKKEFSEPSRKWVVEEYDLVERAIDVKEKYGIDFESLWGLSDK